MVLASVDVYLVGGVFAVAPALLTDADFLVLDEATSDLDSGLEADLQSSIESMDREVGIIAITYRLSTVRNTDRI